MAPIAFSDEKVAAQYACSLMTAYEMCRDENEDRAEEAKACLDELLDEIIAQPALSPVVFIALLTMSSELVREVAEIRSDPFTIVSALANGIHGRLA